MNSHYQIAYLSTATSDFSNSDLEQLLKKSRQSNALAHITGMLIFNAGHFFQYIEGEEIAVRNLYDRISRDPRHNDIKIVFEDVSTKRLFPNWSMGSKNPDDFDHWLRDKIENTIGRLSRGETLLNTDQVRLVLNYIADLEDSRSLNKT